MHWGRHSPFYGTDGNCATSGHAADEMVVCNQLTKVYDNGKVAVNNVSLGIPRGECFGLLGTNGTYAPAQFVGIPVVPP